MELKPSNIPEALKASRQWIVWKTASRHGKPTKVPFQITGKEAKSNEPGTWSSFDSAWEAYTKGNYDGPGFVFSHYDKFVGIDLDGCRNPKTGEVAQWAKDVIRTLNSYSEVSPSETGVKVFVAATNPFATGKKKELDNPQMVADKKPGIEMYSHGRYFAVTGWRLGGVSADIEQRDLQWIREEFWPEENRTPRLPSNPNTAPVVDRARRYMATLPAGVSGASGHNRTFHAACVLVLGFGLEDTVALGLMREYNVRCQPQWSESELAHKVQSASTQSGERNYLRDAKPENWKQINVPNYGGSEDSAKPQTQARRTTLEAAAEKYLKYLDEGKGGLLSLGLSDVDYALGGGIAPGEIVILAARPSHGKSAVALQCIHNLSATGLASIIISEEMSSLAIGKRVIQFAVETPEEHWKTSGKIVRGTLGEHFGERAPCRIVEACNTAAAAAEEIRKAVGEIGAKIAVIDYAQLLSSEKKTEYEDVTATSKILTAVAHETEVTLLMVCQLNRGVENRPKFTPKMRDIRGAGQLEQDADVILFLCWPWKLDDTRNPNEYLIFVGKNRNRAVNQVIVKCEFNPTRQMVLPESTRGIRRYANDEAGTRSEGDGRFPEFEHWQNEF